MDDEVYVIDTSSEASEAPSLQSSPSLAAGETCGFPKSCGSNGAQQLLPPHCGTAHSATKVPPLTVSTGTCTDRAFTGDSETEAMLHQEVLRLATLLPAATGGSRVFRKVRRVEEAATPAATDSEMPHGGAHQWMATLQSLKRPRTPAMSPDSYTAKQEPVPEDLPDWTTTLVSTMNSLQRLVENAQTAVAAPASAPPMCLLSPVDVDHGAVVRGYEPEPVGTSTSSTAHVSTLEAEARLVIGREHLGSLLPLYKELLQLRKERERAVLASASHQETLLGTQTALLSELEATCRHDLQRAEATLHERCSSEAASQYAVQRLEEDVQKLQAVRAGLGNVAPSVAHRPATDASASAPPFLTPNERRQPGKAASAYLHALEETLEKIQAQNAQLQSRLDQLMTSNQQLKERCAASARGAAQSAHDGGWVRKEVLLKLLSTRQHGFEAVAKALGWSVQSSSSEQVVLVGETQTNQGKQLCVDLVERSPTPQPAEPEAVDGNSRDATELKREDDSVRPTSLSASPQNQSHEQSPPTRASSTPPHTEEDEDETTPVSSRAVSLQDDKVQSFPSSEGSACSALLEDPGARNDGVSDRDISPPAPQSVASATDANEEEEQQEEGEEEDGELMDRTDETLVASMNGTTQSGASPEESDEQNDQV